VPRTRPPFPLEFRREAVELMRVTDKPLAELSKDLASVLAVFCGERPSSLFSSVAKATARGPSIEPAAPNASEV